MRSSSIARRLRRSFFFMLALSLLLIVAGASLIRGAAGNTSYGMPGNRFRGQAEHDTELLAELNRLLNAPPGLSGASEPWTRLERMFPGRAFLVIGEEGVVYKSRVLSDNNVLPFLYRQGTNPIAIPDQTGFPGAARQPLLIFRWNATLADGTRADLFVFSVKDEPFWTTAFGRLVFVILAILLFIGLNGFMTWSILYHLLVPLRTLEAAALRIRDGDLSRQAFPLFDREFHAVFEAFDRMREKLRESLERQEKDNETRRELIASISHDLRTPIAAIKGYAEGLRDGVASTEEKRRLYIDTILAKSAHMDKLIDNLFLLSRLELKDELFEYTEINLATFLGDCLGELRFDYPAMDIRFSAEEELTTRADQFQLRRVVINLAQNAFRHNPNDGKSLAVRLYRDGTDAVIEFGDNGPGFSEEDLTRAFDRFYRADKSRGGGSGLGLSISKMVMEAMGGSIEAKNAVPRGALLVLRFPLARKDA